MSYHLLFEPGWRGNLIAFFAGILLVCAFSPIKLSLIAVIAPIFLLAAWLPCNPRQAALRGFIFGLGLFGFGVPWVYVSIYKYGGTPPIIAGLFTALFIITLSLFPTVQGYILTKFFPKDTISKRFLAFPATYALFEWVRTWFLTGFPWLFLAHSQINSPMKGFIPIIGEFGTTFLIALSSALILTFITSYLKDTRLRYASLSIILVTVLWLSGQLLSYIRWTQPNGLPLTISLIQGNIPQNLKWDPIFLKETLRRYEALTQPFWGKNLIVWPEAAIPLTLQEAQKFVLRLGQVAAKSHSTLITGIPVRVGTNEYYNSVISLGEGRGIYNKQHLVPFGEYLPLERWLRGTVGFFNLPMSSFIPGAKIQPPVYAGKIIIAPFICYEIAYSSLLREYLPQAEVLIMLSNDAWFGDSFAPWQQLQIGQMRAIQTGRYLVSATNDGITAIVNPSGKIQLMAPQFKEWVLSDTIQPMVGSTPWMRLGDLPWLILIFGLLSLAFIAQKEIRQST